LTLVVFVVQFMRRRASKKPGDGCGGGCDCPTKPPRK
jgi:hypothetical protein